MPEVPEEFFGVTVAVRANIYFEGRVISHAIILPDQSRKTLGVIFPGEYHFNTKAAEVMQITNGSCEVEVDGTSQAKSYVTGDTFQVPASSGFTITVKRDLCEYICSFLS